MAANKGNGGGAFGSVQFLADGTPIVGNMEDIADFATMQWGNWEFIEQSLYDSFAYAAAGTTGITLFQTPQGQGTGFGGGAKTASDTNMVNAGMLSQGLMQLVTSLEIEFQPATPTVAAGMPAAFGAQAVATSVNDAFVFWRSGNLVFKVLAKIYVQEAPLMRFPGNADFSLQAALADATTAAAASQSRIAYASSYGQPYVISPQNILIPSTTNFFVALNWPEGVQAITNPARVFVHLNGMEARLAQ
jgi:hypothetical protein